ncbi:hypothetical protein H9P43_003249 [Blastocladiella emersonii ATCC 22665]|nr:hypothetical protein H9P43_003249 [Blastocladiella emersonii ATCC 22665]
MQSPLLILVAALLALVLAADPANAQCRVRKELRRLSSSERAALTRGMLKLYQNGEIERLRQHHADSIPVAHGNPNFALWHRSFMWRFESLLLNAAGGGLTGLPYHDISRDSANPASSAVWGSDLMGSNGACVGAPYADVRINGACLKRMGPEGNWGGCAPTVLASMINSNQEYTSFSTAIEGVCHNRVHSSFPDSPQYFTTQSPSDLWHAGLDKYLAMWQNKNSKVSNVNMNDVFNGKTVATLFAYSSGPDCYVYDDVPAPDGKWNGNGGGADVDTGAGKSTTASSATSTAASTTTSATGTTTTTSTSATATPTATDAASTGKDATVGDIDSWIPPFETIPDAFWASMGNMWSKDQIEAINRIFKGVLTYLQRLKAEGKKLPTIADLRNITGNANWTPDGIKKMQAAGNASTTAAAAADKTGAAGQSAAVSAAVLVGAVVACTMAMVGI